MKRKPDNYRIPPRTKLQCKLHQQIAQFAAELDRPRDIQQAREDQPRTAPLCLLPMVF